MTNPFEQIDNRLNNIESLLLDIKHGLLRYVPVVDAALQRTRIRWDSRASHIIKMWADDILHKPADQVTMKDVIEIMANNKRAVLQYRNTGRKTHLLFETEIEAYLKEVESKY